MKYLKYIGLVVVIGVLAVPAMTNPAPHTRADIDAYAVQLFEFGALRYVHGLDGDTKTAQQLLFDRVAAGDVLTQAESCTYRTAYWLLLQEHARRFQLADDDLQMVRDFGMDEGNNCGAMGIAGEHDMHDHSARANFDELRQNLIEIEGTAGWWRKIVLINEVQKNLVDLTVHYAPATHSIGVAVPIAEASGRLGAEYAVMQTAYKSAQFAPIHSEVYWDNVDAALAAYSAMIAEVQGIIWANSSALQRRFAGRWLSLQTVAPMLDHDDCIRPRPNPKAPICS